MDKKTKKILIIAGCVLAVLVIVFGAFLIFGKPATTEGEKHITLTITHKDETQKVVEINTSEEYLGFALANEGLVGGDQGDFGLWVKTVDGYTGDDSKQEWWNFILNGEFLNTGVDQTPINDGDKIDAILTVGF